MLIPWVPLLLLLIGLLTYALASQPKVAELGRLTFAVGLLVALLGLVGRTVLRL